MEISIQPEVRQVSILDPNSKIPGQQPVPQQTSAQPAQPQTGVPGGEQVAQQPPPAQTADVLVAIAEKMFKNTQMLITSLGSAVMRNDKSPAAQEQGVAAAFSKFSAGDTVTGLVTKQHGPDMATVKLGETEFLAKTPRPLEAGEKILVRIDSAGQKLSASLILSDRSPSEQSAGILRQYLPAREETGRLMDRLASALTDKQTAPILEKHGATELAARVKDIFGKLTLPAQDAPVQPGAIKSVLNDSGMFYENKLLKAILPDTGSAAPPQTAGKTGLPVSSQANQAGQQPAQPSAGMTEEKQIAALGRMIAALTQGQPASPTPAGVSQAQAQTPNAQNLPPAVNSGSEPQLTIKSDPQALVTALKAAAETDLKPALIKLIDKIEAAIRAEWGAKEPVHSKSDTQPAEQHPKQTQAVNPQADAQSAGRSAAIQKLADIVREAKTLLGNIELNQLTNSQQAQQSGQTGGAPRDGWVFHQIPVSFAEGSRTVRLYVRRDALSGDDGHGGGGQSGSKKRGDTVGVAMMLDFSALGPVRVDAAVNFKDNSVTGTVRTAPGPVNEFVKSALPELVERLGAAGVRLDFSVGTARETELTERLESVPAGESAGGRGLLSLKI